MENKDGRHDHLTLTSADYIFVMTKNGANRLGFAVLLGFFRDQGRFPRAESEIDRNGIEEIAQQLDVALPLRNTPTLSERTAELYRAEIRAYLGYREATVADAEMLSEWLRDQAAVVGGVRGVLTPLLGSRCRELFIQPPSTDRADRFIPDVSPLKRLCAPAVNFVTMMEAAFCAQSIFSVSPQKLWQPTRTRGLA